MGDTCILLARECDDDIISLRASLDMYKHKSELLISKRLNEEEVRMEAGLAAIAHNGED